MNATYSATCVQFSNEFSPNFIEADCGALLCNQIANSLMKDGLKSIWHVK